MKLSMNFLTDIFLIIAKTKAIKIIYLLWDNKIIEIFIFLPSAINKCHTTTHSSCHPGLYSLGQYTSTMVVIKLSKLRAT